MGRLSGYGRIIKLGLPILIGQLGMIVVGFADTAMVGRYSTEALASASFVNNLFNVAIFGTIGFSYGLTPLIGALFSGRRHGEIGALVKNGLLLNVLFSLLVMGLMLVGYFNLHLMGQPEELLPLIRPYYLIYLVGMLPVVVFNVFAQWSYAVRNTSMPMWITLAANVVNIFGNWLLIYGNLGCPEMGLTGAGLATLAARLFCPLVIIGVFFLKPANRPYRHGFAVGRLKWQSLRRVSAVSWPVSLQMVFESGSFSGAAVMAGWLDAISLAAFQITVIIGTLGFCIYYSMASAVSVLVANAAGEGDRTEMRAIATRGYRIILCMAAASSLFFIFGARQFVWLFTSDAAVAATATSLIVPLVAYQLGDATQINYANALRGTAKVMPMLWIALISYVVVGLPATYLMAFTFGMGIYGIVLSFSVSLFLAAGLFFYFFRRATAPRTV